MKLNDIGRPTLRYRIGWGFCLGLALTFAGSTAWFAYELHTSMAMNSDLTRIIDERLDSIVVARVTTVNSIVYASLQEALRTGGSRAVDSILAAAVEPAKADDGG